MFPAIRRKISVSYTAQIIIILQKNILFFQLYTSMYYISRKQVAYFLEHRKSFAYSKILIKICTFFFKECWPCWQQIKIIEKINHDYYFFVRLPFQHFANENFEHEIMTLFSVKMKETFLHFTKRIFTFGLLL